MGSAQQHMPPRLFSQPFRNGTEDVDGADLKRSSCEAPEPAHPTQGTAGPVAPGMWIGNPALFFVLRSSARAVQPHSAHLS